MAGSDVTLRFSADLAPFVQAAVKANARVANLKDGTKKLQAEMDRMSRSMDKSTGSFDKTATSGSRVGNTFKSMGAKLAGAVAGVNVLSEAFRALQDRIQAADAAARRITQQQDAMKRLQQVSGSVTEFQLLKAQAQKVAVNEGITVQRAAQIVFAAKSQGLMGDIGVLAQTQGFTDAEAMANAVGKQRSVFGAGAGSTRQIISRLLAAAATSDVTVELIAQSAAVAATGVKQQGGTSEELFSFLSVLSPAFKSPDVAAQRIQALATEFAKDDRLAGRGLFGGLAAFQQLPAAERTEMMRGRQEFAQAMTGVLENIDKIQTQSRRLAEQNRTTSAFDTQLNIIETDPNIRRVRAEQSAKVRADIAEETALAPTALSLKEEESRLRETIAALYDTAGPGGRVALTVSELFPRLERYVSRAVGADDYAAALAESRRLYLENQTGVDADVSKLLEKQIAALDRLVQIEELKAQRQQPDSLRDDSADDREAR